MTKIQIAKAAAEQALSMERERAGARLQNTWRFVAAIILVLGFQVRDLKELVESPAPAVKILACASLAVLGLALVLAVFSLPANGEGAYPRGQKLWENLKPDSVSESAAEEAMVLMLLQTREQTARANDAKARWARWCGWLFLAGTLLAAGSQLLDAFENWS